MDAALRASLAAIAGEKSVDGSAGIVSPGSVEQVEQVCAALAAAGVRIAVTSASPARGAAAPAGAVLVSLGLLKDVSVEPERLVVRAGAGASLAAVRTAAEKAGMSLAGASGEAPEAPVGELVALGRLSRRAVTGVEAVLADGRRVSAGGLALKDVAGYDLAAALLGSLGRLALVTAVSLRLQPRAIAARDGAPAGIPTLVLGDALERAFDPQRLLVGRA